LFDCFACASRSAISSGVAGSIAHVWTQMPPTKSGFVLIKFCVIGSYAGGAISSTR
jgi:hypothetical protein